MLRLKELYFVNLEAETGRYRNVPASEICNLNLVEDEIQALNFVSL